MKAAAVIFSCAAAQSFKCDYNEERDSWGGGDFGSGFRWSLATASYQIEGSHDADGKGQNIWDKFSHIENYPGVSECHIDECHNGDISCDSYKNMDRDIEQMVKMGIHWYRFSLSWTRLMPNGKRGENDAGVNQKGIDHYRNFINKLKENDIEPMVTLYHWDLPQALQDDYQGWLGDQIVADFEDYARLCYDKFGDLVTYWITINEPQVVSDEGYGWAEMAPGIENEQFNARHNTLRAHARAYNVYNEEFRQTQNGQVGLTMNSDWYEGLTDSEDDAEAGQMQLDLQLGFWADPVYGDTNGDYNPFVKKLMAKHADIYGYTVKTLTEQEKALNKGSADFFGLNHYSTRLMTKDPDDFEEVKGHTCDNWPKAGSSWLYSVPWGFRRLLTYIHKKYGKTIFVTENGISSKHVGANPSNGTDLNPELNDQWRINHYHAYIGQMHRAIKEDNADIATYTAWSLMDNFEWARGYTERFGMIWVNFTKIWNEPDYKPEESVLWKDSAKFYEGVVKSNNIEGSSSSAGHPTAIICLLVTFFFARFL